jgi:ATP-dependent RNA helicase DDX35
LELVLALTMASSVAAAVAGRPLKMRIHPSSVLFRTQPQLVVFLGCQQNDEGWYEMQGVTAIQADWLTELVPGVFRKV